MTKQTLSILAILLTSICFARSPLETQLSPHEALYPRECEEGPPKKITSLYLDGSSGDYVVGGKKCYKAEEEGNKFSILSYSPNTIEVRFSNSEDYWGIQFETRHGDELTTGIYKNAQRFKGSDHPGFSISGCGRGCNQSSGEFEILELAYGAGGKVESFAANFIQKCEFFGPPLFGTVRYNSSIPIEPRFVEDFHELSILYIEFTDGNDPSYHTCTIRTDANGISFKPLPFGGNGVVIEVAGSDDEPWVFAFAAPHGEDFKEKSYPYAVRYPFQDSFSSGMELQTPDGPIAFEEGEFTVLNLEKNASGEIVSLTLDFEATTRDNMRIRGAIRFNPSEQTLESHPYPRWLTN